MRLRSPFGGPKGRGEWDGCNVWQLQHGQYLCSETYPQTPPVRIPKPGVHSPIYPLTLTWVQRCGVRTPKPGVHIPVYPLLITQNQDSEWRGFGMDERSRAWQANRVVSGQLRQAATLDRYLSCLLLKLQCAFKLRGDVTDIIWPIFTSDTFEIARCAANY